MRMMLCLVGFLTATAVQAQPERYELGRKVRLLEQTWEANPPSAEAKKRATPLINQAVQSFFRFNLPAAGKFIDEARHALLSADAPSAGVKWADAVSVQPETRLLDSGKGEWTLAIKLFYKPDAPTPEKPLARVTIGGGKPKEFPLDKLPASVNIALTEIPGPVTADLPVRVEILAGEKSLAVKTLALSRVENLDARLTALKEAADAKPAKPGIEGATLTHLSKLLADLATKSSPETDYPAAKMLTEAEQLTKAPTAFYDASRTGERWLALPTKKGPSIVRMRLPETVSKDKPLPVVIALHGMGGSENMYFDAYGNGIIPKLAGDRGWLVVGTRVGGLLGAGAAPDVPAILDLLAERYPIDRQRVFLVGHSMGAGHAMLLAQQTPERFAGIAAMGGGGKVGKPDAVKNLPFFIGCGKQDFALRGAKLMNDSLTAVNGPVTFKEYDDIEHLAIVQEAARDVFAFFDKLAAKPK